MSGRIESEWSLSTGYACLGDPMDKGAWRATIHGVAKESNMTEWLHNNNGVLLGEDGEHVKLDCEDGWENLYIKNIASHCQEALTGGFLCAVLDLSGILCSLLIPEYSGIKKRGKPLPGAEESRHFLH